VQEKLPLGNFLLALDFEIVTRVRRMLKILAVGAKFNVSRFF
jgi:hypothetical protein